MPENLEAVIEKARRDAFPPLSVVPAFEESEEEKSHRSAIPTEKSTKSSTNTFTGSKNTFDSMTNPHVESSRHSWMEFPPRSDSGAAATTDDSSSDKPLHRYTLRVFNKNKALDSSWKIRISNVVIGVYSGAADADQYFSIPVTLISPGVPFTVSYELVKDNKSGDWFYLYILDEFRREVLVSGSNATTSQLKIPL